MKDTQHLTTKELAERLRVNEQTPRKWRMTGYGPKALKIGKKVVYSLVEIEKWEKSHLSASTADS